MMMMNVDSLLLFVVDEFLLFLLLFSLLLSPFLSFFLLLLHSSKIFNNNINAIIALVKNIPTIKYR